MDNSCQIPVKASWEAFTGQVILLFFTMQVYPTCSGAYILDFENIKVGSGWQHFIFIIGSIPEDVYIVVLTEIPDLITPPVENNDIIIGKVLNTPDEPGIITIIAIGS